jgi:hypothetical protein
MQNAQLQFHKLKNIFCALTTITSAAEFFFLNKKIKTPKTRIGLTKKYS